MLEIESSIFHVDWVLKTKEKSTNVFFVMDYLMEIINTYPEKYILIQIYLIFMMLKSNVTQWNNNIYNKQELFSWCYMTFGENHSFKLSINPSIKLIHNQIV